MDPVPVIMIERNGEIFELRPGGGWYVNDERIVDPKLVTELDAVAGKASVALARGQVQE